MFANFIEALIYTILYFNKVQRNGHTNPTHNITPIARDLR